MKRHTDRPALRAMEVWRWITKGILKVTVLRDAHIFYLNQGKAVRQRWLKRVKGKVEIRTSMTYLRKGTFLVPIWQVVADWEINYLHEKNVFLDNFGIVLYDQKYYRLCYMQVEDLDHTRRQQDHVLDNYFDSLLSDNFPDFWAELSRQNRIIQEIEGRKISAENFYVVVAIRLKSISRSLRSIIKNAPLFRQDFSQEQKERSRETAINVLEKIARECQTFTFRPVCHRLRYAARSLKLAAEHLRNRHLGLAKKRLQSALKNLTYPPET